MTTAFDVLEGLVNTVDPTIRPVFEQIARITKFLSDSLEEHSKLNVTDIGALQSGMSAITQRTAGAERLIASQADQFEVITRQFKEVDRKLNYLNGERAAAEVKISGVGEAALAQASAKFEPALVEQTNLIAGLAQTLKQAETAYVAQQGRIANLEAATGAGGDHGDVLDKLISRVTAVESSMTVNQLHVKGSMADAKRCQSLGKLGESSVGFEQWIDAIEALVSEKYGFGSTALAWARALGADVLTTELLSDLADEQGLDIEVLNRFDRDIWGLLQQQTGATLYTHIKTAKGRGLEAWRRIWQVCNPQNVGSAESLRADIVRERHATGLAELQALLAQLDDWVSQYDRVSTSPLEDGVYVLGLRAVLPQELIVKIDTDPSVERKGPGLRKWIDAYVARALSSSRKPGSQGAVPMHLGAADDWTQVGAGGKAQKIQTAPPAEGSMAALQKQLNDLKSQLGQVSAAWNTPAPVGAVGGGQPQKGKGKGKKGACFRCGGDHLIRDCPVPPAPHEQARPGKGGKDGGKGKNGKGGKGGKQRYGWQVCRHFATTGKCPHLEQKGWCRFAHVRMPAALGNIQGIVFEDVAEHARYDPQYNTYTVPESAVQALSGLAERVAGELSEINADAGPSIATLGEFIPEKHVTFDGCDGCSDF